MADGTRLSRRIQSAGGWQRCPVGVPTQSPYAANSSVLLDSPAAVVDRGAAPEVKRYFTV